MTTSPSWDPDWSGFWASCSDPDPRVREPARNRVCDALWIDLRPSAHRALAGLSTTPQSTEDLLASALGQVHQADLWAIPFRSYEALRRYVGRALRNKRTDYTRRARVRSFCDRTALEDVVEVASDERGPAERAILAEEFEVVLDCIDALPDAASRDIARGRLLHDLPWGRIGARCGLAPDAARMRFERRILPAIRRHAADLLERPGGPEQGVET